MDLGHRPDAIQRASERAGDDLHAFHIDDRTGVQHLGLPPGFGADPAGADR
jgi:hypothetical protein